jgi:hypothetical protein
LWDLIGVLCLSVIDFIGGAGEDRTHDLLTARHGNLTYSAVVATGGGNTKKSAETPQLGTNVEPNEKSMDLSGLEI